MQSVLYTISKDLNMQSVLLDISNDLVTDDVEVMSYLLKWSGKINLQEHDKCKNKCVELFKTLRKGGHLNETNVYLLYDILNLIAKEASTKLTRYFKGKIPGNERISGYIKSLYEFGSSFSEKEVSNFKFLLKIPEGKSEKIKNFWQLFDYASRKGKVENKPVSVMEFINNHLPEKLYSLKEILRKNGVSISAQTTNDNQQLPDVPVNLPASSAASNSEITRQPHYDDPTVQMRNMNINSNNTNASDLHENKEIMIFEIPSAHDSVERLNEIKSFMSNKEIGRGQYGIVYEGQKEFKNCKVAIKELTDRNHKANDSLIKEKTVAKLVHPHLLPVFAIGCDESSLYIMYPYMEGGDLEKAIQNGTKLNGISRIRISYQISQVLQFLHQELPVWKKAFCHCDVKLSNILLDKNGNARLSDMGLAKEIESTDTYTSWVSSKRDQAGIRTLQGYDVFCLGIVMLEMVLNKVFNFSNMDLRSYRQNNTAIQSDAFEKIWSSLESIEKFANCITTALGKANADTEHITSEQLVEDLFNILMEFSDKRFLTSTETNDKCSACMINKSVSLEPRICSKKSDSGKKCKPFCTKCNKLSYRNPMYCPSHGACSPPIGYNTFALIVAGNAEDERTANIFISGAKAMEKIMRSKHPVIMDIEDSNIFTSFPQEPGKHGQPNEMKTDVLNKLDKIKKFIDDKSKKGEISFFIFVYTGHGSERKINLDSNDVLWDTDFQDKISKWDCKMLFILDCCYAGTIALTGFQLVCCCNVCDRNSADQFDKCQICKKFKPRRDVFQWSSIYNESQPVTEDCEGKGTVFIQCILNLLRGELYSDYSVCDRKSADQFDKCQICKKFKLACSEQKFISYKTLHSFADEHRNDEKYGKSKSCHNSANADPDFPLAYYTDKDEELRFRIVGSEPRRIMNLCPVISMDDLKSILLSKIKEEKPTIPNDIETDLVQVCKVDRENGDRVEIQNLSDISVHREDLDLEVTLRENPDYILNGPVALLLHSPNPCNPEDLETILESMNILKQDPERKLWMNNFNHESIISEFKTPLQNFTDGSELGNSLKKDLQQIQEKVSKKLNHADPKTLQNLCTVKVEIKNNYLKAEAEYNGF